MLLQPEFPKKEECMISLLLNIIVIGVAKSIIDNKLITFGYSKTFSPPLLTTTGDEIEGILYKLHKEIADLISLQYFGSEGKILIKSSEYVESNIMFNDFDGGFFDGILFFHNNSLVTSCGMYTGGYVNEAPRRWNYFHSCSVLSHKLSFFVDSSAPVTNLEELREYFKQNAGAKKIQVASQNLLDITKEFLRDIPITVEINDPIDVFTSIISGDEVIAIMPEYLSDV